ncbi:MAG: FAD:protein FMN transferase [Prolixibacteraceae bacterium]|jgi:FAD:protein FMN transferase|nr:FAD:protein FMN transferase [Prolixibacteraceae bacterium]MBT6766366.1 FAD:protein FMN transferase [Prolixibacteraceae bacterium]MBT6999266.1 FAD:protein FMN transferase [Prolixibacteraceae bacterium]MBT7396359.1 FAD:protein FMN transferase [Prolixibacteraceae bacterium]
MKTKLLLLFYLIILSNSCQKSSSKYIYNKGFVYGTMYSIVYESPDGVDHQEEITAKFQEYTLIFSPFEAESVISKINNNEQVKLSDEFIACFNRSIEISEITNGAFDITAGPMVNAWGFGPEEKKKMTPEIIDSLIQITGYKKIQLKNSKISKENPDMKLDMSAIAKGFTSDLVAGFLKEKGCVNYMVEIGGEVAAKGKNERGKTWTIGISKPDENAFLGGNEIQAKVQLPGHALATSGNYRNFYVEDGKKFAHTIDPKTGYPVQHSLLSATVLAENCMTADAFATAFMVLGLEKSIAVSEQITEIMVYFIYSDANGNNQEYMSENFELHLVD